MKSPEIASQIETLAEANLNRRTFFRQAGYFGLGAAVSGLALANGTPADAQANTYQTKDTTAQMFTAFLIAEDLASVFYYNGLTGAVIKDPSLAGPGGSPNRVSPSGDAGNVMYLQAALGQEISHANTFRTYLTGTSNGSAQDPYQTFYFPTGTFDNLTNFLAILDALENAFIGAYLCLVQEMAYKATLAATGKLLAADKQLTAQHYILYSKVAASILGVECEHRVIGRDIGGHTPINNLIAEATDGITSIYNGPNSAVVALTPFLTPSTGPGYSLQTTLANHRNVDLPSQGGVPLS
jgi:hypothetical protein